MNDNILEVRHAVVETWDDQKVEVSGGAYLSPDVYLTTSTELARLKDRQAEVDRSWRLVPPLLLGAGVLGLVAGYLLADRREPAPRRRPWPRFYK